MPPLFWLDIAALSISTVIATSLVLMVLGTGPRRALNRSFALFTLMEAAWAVFSLLLRLALWLERGNPLLLSELAALTFCLMAPSLLIFTIRYVGHRPRWPDLAAALGLATMAVLTIPLFRHQLLFNPRLDTNGSTTMDLGAWGMAVAALPALYLVWSLVLFWQERRRIREPYLTLSVLTLMVGFVLGGVLEIRLPVLSITNTLSVAILGYRVISQQLFNPLRERTAELQRQIAERVRTEEALRESEETARALLNAPTESAMLLNTKGTILALNETAAQRLGKSADELVGLCLYDLFSPAVAKLRKERIDEAIRSGEPVRFEDERRRRIFDNSIYPISDAQGRVARVAVFAYDITERKRAERLLKRTQAQLVQAQKMDAIGQLTSGIAHDFNNLLTTIVGFTRLLLREAPEGSQQREDLRRIEVAAERATALTRQLRLFTRQEKGERHPVRLNSVVEETRDLLRRSIPTEITMELRLEPKLWAVEADPSQISQVLVNLCVNARDAMPGGGILTLETQNVTLDEEEAQARLAARPGRYVRLSVSDTGIGMSPEVQARLFEPFFTTKERGKGTGLGLAVVYGIVKGHNGFIKVYSEAGQGSTFHVYLPAIELAVEEGEVKVLETVYWHGDHSAGGR